jgi:hypothetical protein
VEDAQPVSDLLVAQAGEAERLGQLGAGATSGAQAHERRRVLEVGGREDDVAVALRALQLAEEVESAGGAGGDDRVGHLATLPGCNITDVGCPGGGVR